MPGDELTEAEQQLVANILVHRMALEEIRREWVEHYYPPGEEPDDPQPWRDAQSAMLNEASGLEELPEETRVLAYTFNLAAEKLQDAIDIATAEINITRGVEWLEEANKQLEETQGEDPDPEEE